VIVQIGSGSLVQAIETVIKGMTPGEESTVFIDARAMHELRDMLMDNLMLEIELKTILDGPPDEIIGATSFPLGFSGTMDAANVKKTMGTQHLQKLEHDQAIEQYTQGLQLLSTLENLPPPELVESKKLQIILHMNISHVYTTISATNLAIQHAQNALDLLDHGSPLPEVTSNRCKAYFRLGQAYEKAGQYQSSLWNYVRAAKIMNDPAIHACATRVKPLAEKEKAMANV
jgi:tetratricopeptide (TPR) repeat protein